MTQPMKSHELAQRAVRPGETLLDDISLPPTVATPPHVLAAIVDMAIEIAREGREGRRIGTILTVGDHEEVLRRSRCLILDPLAHHRPELRSVLRPDTRETIKELAQLDGGFIISDDGVVESACRYFESSLEEIEPHLGLGTRHIAAASITRATRALAVVVSESSVVRVFHDGHLATEILPELWLLRRFIPHLHNPHLTERRDENIVVFGEFNGPPRNSEPQPPSH
jgi:diadenylate cyclase